MAAGRTFLIAIISFGVIFLPPCDVVSSHRQRPTCTMKVAEDSSRFSYTCQADIKDNQVVEVLRSPTVDEDVDVSSSGFRLVGRCHGCRQKVCSSQLPDLFAVNYTGKGLTVASVLPVERQSTGGVWMCRLSEDNGKRQKVLTVVSLCRIDVIYAPNRADTVCRVKVREDDWSVEGSCSVPKTFSFQKNYTCHWHVAQRSDVVVPKEATAYNMKSYVDPVNNREYRSGVCSFKHRLSRFVSALYTYHAVFSPGQVVAEAPLLSIVAPWPPIATCATAVKSKDRFNCTCETHELGTPAGRLVWKVGEKVLVKGAKGQTVLPLVVQQANGFTDVTCVLEWARNLAANRTVVVDGKARDRNFTFNGQRVPKENSWVSATDVSREDLASGSRQRPTCTMEVAEDSPGFKYTCKTDIKDNQVVEVLRSPTVDEDVDVSSSGFRLVGRCHGGRQKVCSSQLPDLFAVNYTKGKGLTVASVLPVERQSTGGVWMCRLSEDNGKRQKVLTVVSLCRIDVIYAPNPADTVCRVKVREDDWSVEGSCSIPKTFSFQKNYACRWRVANSLDVVVPKEATAYNVKSYVDPVNNREYRSGVCSFKHRLSRFVSALYTYHAVFSPGQVVAEAPSLSIVTPSQPAAICPTSVKSGDTFNCTCETRELGTPAGRLVWKVGEKVLLLGAKGQTVLPLVVQRANADTGVTCVLEWARNFVTDRSIVVYGKESIQRFTINGQSGMVVTKENSSVSFECSFTGKPAPIIRLIKGIYPMSVGKQLGAVQPSQSSHSVTIAAVSCRDTGTYTCAARQEVVEQVRYARLLVECAPHLTTPSKSTFEKPLQLVYSPPERHSLRVHILSHPPPGNPELGYLGQRGSSRQSKSFGMCTDCPNTTCLQVDDDAGNKVVCLITARNIRPEHTGLYILRLSNVRGVLEVPFLVKTRRPETSAVRPKMAAAIVVVCVVTAVMCVCAILVLQARRLPQGKTRGSNRTIFKQNPRREPATTETEEKEGTHKPVFKRDRQQTSETFTAQNTKSRNQATVRDNDSDNKETYRSDRVSSLGNFSENALINTSRNKEDRVNVWILSLEDSSEETLDNGSINNNISDIIGNTRVRPLESSNGKTLDNRSGCESIISIKGPRVNEETLGAEERSSLEESSGKVACHSYQNVQSTQRDIHAEHLCQSYGTTAGDGPRCQSYGTTAGDGPRCQSYGTTAGDGPRCQSYGTTAGDGPRCQSYGTTAGDGPRRAQQHAPGDLQHGARQNQVRQKNVYELGCSPRDNNTSACVSVHDPALVCQDKGTSDGISCEASCQNPCGEISYRAQCSASRSKAPDEASVGSQDSVCADLLCKQPPAELCVYASDDPVCSHKCNKESSLELISDLPEKLGTSAPSGLRTLEKGIISVQDGDFLPENIANVRDECNGLLQPDEADLPAHEIQDSFLPRMAQVQAVGEGHSPHLSAGSEGSDKGNITTFHLPAKTTHDGAKELEKDVADENSSDNFLPVKEATETLNPKCHNHLSCEQTIIPQLSLLEEASTEGCSSGVSPGVPLHSSKSSESYKKNPLHDELINEFRHALVRKNLGETMAFSDGPDDSNGEGIVSDIASPLKVYEIVPSGSVQGGIQNNVYRQLTEPPESVRSPEVSEYKPVQVLSNPGGGMTMYLSPNENKKSANIQRRRSWKWYKKSKEESGHYKLTSANNNTVRRVILDCSSSEYSSGTSDISDIRVRTRNRVRELFRDLQNKAKDYVSLSPNRLQNSNSFSKSRLSCQSRSDHCGTKTKPVSSKIPQVITGFNVDWQNSHSGGSVGLISEDDQQDRRTFQKARVYGDTSKPLEDLGKVKKVRSKLPSGRLKRIFSMNRKQPKVISVMPNLTASSYVTCAKGNAPVKEGPCTPDDDFIVGLQKPVCATKNCENGQFSYKTEVCKVLSRPARSCVLQESDKILSEAITETPVRKSVLTCGLAFEGDPVRKNEVHSVHHDSYSPPRDSDNRDRVKVHGCLKDDIIPKERSENPQSLAEDGLVVVLPHGPSENNVRLRDTSAAKSSASPGRTREPAAGTMYSVHCALCTPRRLEARRPESSQLSASSGLKDSGVAPSSASSYMSSPRNNEPCDQTSEDKTF